MSNDERFIATANPDGSIGVLRVHSPDQWPKTTELSDEAPYSKDELTHARLELETLLAEGNESIVAFEQRLAAATTEDEKNEIRCEEPQSGIMY